MWPLHLRRARVWSVVFLRRCKHARDRSALRARAAQELLLPLLLPEGRQPARKLKYIFI